MSIKRGIAPAASVVCRVDSTKCPVSAALMARPAVSSSLISPTMMISGSCLTSTLRPAANVNPIWELTWVWLILGIRYSMGSSTVEIFTSEVLRMSIMAYRVVVFPDPVGPVINIMPEDLFKLSWICFNTFP